MGAPNGHPFYGNQYTDGGYSLGTFTYEGTCKAIDAIKAVSDEVKVNVKNISTKKKPDSLIPEAPIGKDSSIKALVVGSVILAVITVSGLITDKLLRKKTMEKQKSLQSIQLRNVGICTHCREPLIESTYALGNEENSDTYIICKKCGEKNFAWYPDKGD